MIFVDTAFWIGLTVPRDPHHAEAQELFQSHASDQWVTSNHVRGETWTALRRKAGHQVAVRFLQLLTGTTRLDTVFVPEHLEDSAIAWLRRRDERDYSFVDATSFALMREMGIRRVLTFDEDFAAAGFKVLRSSG